MNPKPRTSNLEPRTLNRNAAATSFLSGSEERAERYDLEERLLEFSVKVIELSETLPKTRAGNHVAGQFLRAGTSAYGNHGEAQAPESLDDFIHKMKVCLKELREARRWTRLIARMGWLKGSAELAFLLGEVEDLVRIFKASVRTAERRRLTRGERVNPSNPARARG